MSQLHMWIFAACSTCVTTIAVAQAPLCVDPDFRPAFVHEDIAGFDFMADGRILVGGMLRHPAWVGWRARCRLNTDGTVDTGFDQLTGASAGAIRVWGDQYFFQGVTTGVMRCFQSSGVPDPSFGTGWPEFSSSSFGGYHVFPDGKVWKLGWHSRQLYDEVGNNVGSEPGYGLIQVLADGNTDTSFDHKYTAPGGLVSIIELPDGRFLIGCRSGTQYEGHAVGGLIRVWPDGSLDTSFHTTFRSWGVVAPVCYSYPDGRMLVFGSFWAPEYPLDTVNVLRLHPDGSTDTTWPNIDIRYEYAYYSGFGTVMDFLEIEPGKLILVGEFDHVEGQEVGCMTVIDTAGNVLADYLPGTGVQPLMAWNGAGSPSRYLLQIDRGPDGYIYVAGKFHGYDDGCSSNPDQKLITRLYPLNVGIHEQTMAPLALRVYPSPGADVLHVEHDLPTAASIILRSADGRQLLQVEHYRSGTPIASVHLPAGLYLLQLVSDLGSSTTTKWIKQ